MAETDGAAFDAQWRDSARMPRFFFLDCRAVIPLALFLLHIHLWSFLTAISTTMMFWALERYGLSVPVFLRLVRGALAGPRKLALPWWKKPKY